MARRLALPTLLLVLLLSSCSPRARSDKSFDEIRELVTGKTAAQVEALLGAPDTRQPVLLGDERWIWRNYTYLSDNGYLPEVRGAVVHLEILFTRPGAGPLGYEHWRIPGPHAVDLVLPPKPPSLWRRVTGSTE